jgi:transporter family protein
MGSGRRRVRSVEGTMIQGISLVLVSAVLYGVWGTLSKLALKHWTWTQASLWYGIAIVLIMMMLAATLGPGRWEWSTSSVLTVGGAAIAGSLGLVCFYLALERGHASVVVPLFATFPVFTTVFSRAFLGETISLLQIIGIALAVIGVIVISFGSS